MIFDSSLPRILKVPKMSPIPKGVKPAIVMIVLVIWALITTFDRSISVPIYFLGSTIWLAAGYVWYKMSH
jgi:hypothetical protein